MVITTGAYFLSAELSLLQAQRDLEENPLPPLPSRTSVKTKINMPGNGNGNGDENENESQVKITEYSQLKVGQFKPHYPLIAAANFIHDYPFKAVIGCSIPTLGYFLAKEFQKEKITLSQRLIHTRVQGQMSIVAILATIMSFKEYMMQRGGKFTYD